MAATAQGACTLGTEVLLTPEIDPILAAGVAIPAGVYCSSFAGDLYDHLFDNKFAKSIANVFNQQNKNIRCI